MQTMYYIGLDVHKRTISYCVKDGSGTIHAEGTIAATRFDLGGQHTRRRIRKNLYPRSSRAPQESFCPLDKDLSWKSRDQTLKIGTFLFFRLARWIQWVDATLSRNPLTGPQWLRVVRER